MLCVANLFATGHQAKVAAIDPSESECGRRVEAQDEPLADANARLAALVRSSEDAIVSKTLTGTITSWNRGAENIYGYTEQEAVGNSVLMLIPAEHQHELPDILRRVAGGETVRQLETVRVRKDGSRIRVALTISPVRDASDRIVGASIIARDITEQKLAEERLWSSLREVNDLKAALDEHAIVAITDPRGRITFVNDKFCAISKYTRDELIGQDHRIINSGFHPKEFMRDLWETITHGQVWKGEIRNRAKDGSHYWVDTTIVPFLSPEGKPYQYVAIRADITARKEAERQIEELNRELAFRVRDRTKQLEAANRELEAFCYSVSHDLRAPLRHIDGFVELLRNSANPVLPEESRRYLDQLSSRARQMGGLIDDLLMFARMARSEIHRSTFDLRELVEEVRAELQQETGPRRIRWQVDPLPEIDADRAMLRQVVANLLSNAVKYTRPRDPADIRISCDESRADEYVFCVRDNGVGFDMRYVDKLFGVFQRLHLDEDFEGTGIGLANVRRIIARHGGRTWAQGETDTGAAFFFSLPHRESLPKPVETVADLSGARD